MDGIENLLRRNVREVFGQREPSARRAAIADIFAQNCVFIAPTGRYEGRDAVDAAVAAIHAKFPGYVFADGAIRLLDGAGLLEWTFGPHDDPSRVSGTDVALVHRGRIATLLVFLKS